MEGIGSFIPKSISPLVVRRLSRQLPHKSGLTIEEYEQNEVVVVARHFLTSASGFGSFSEVIYGFLTIFDEFIDVNEPLESRSAPVLESILVLLRILSECAYSDWESTSKGIRGPVPPKYQVLQNVLNPLYSRNRVYSTLPDCIHHEVSSKSLKFFMRLKSSNKLAQAAAYVTKNVPIPKRDRDSLIDQIDYYAESILLYISAADWDSTYTLLREELMALKNPSDMSNSNLDLLSIVYLNSIRAQSLLRHIKHIIVNLKSVYKLLVCHFLQDSLQYWYQANGREIYQLDPGIIEISRQLFDYMFKESIDHRQPTLWRFLMMIIVLCPDGFSAFLDGTPKVSKKLASTLNRKAIFLTSANDLLVRSNLFADVSCATSAYISVAKAASSIAPFDKDQTHPTVQFAKSVYHVLRHVLFINTRQSQPFPDLDQLQPLFVSSYCFLMLENLKVDVLQLLQSSLSDIRFQYNIIRGLVGLRHLSTGTQLLSDILDDYSSKLMDFIAALAEAVYTHEKMPYSSDNDSSFGYIMHIQTLRLSLHLLLSHQSESSNFCDLPDNFSRAITRCSVSRNESLRETIALVLKDFLSRFSCEVFRDQELPFDRYHVVLAIFESIGVNIRKSAKTSLKFSFNSREFEKEVTIIARYWETRMFIIENFKFKEIANGDLSRLENLEDRAMLSEAVEEAMVVALCSPSTMLCKLALSNIRCLVQEALMLEDFESNDTSWSIMLNFHIYSELSTPTPFFTALSIQKRMYKLFQNIERPSLALIKAWRKIYDRWSLLNVDVDALEASHEKQKEWRSYSSVLASLLVPLINVDGSLKIPDNIHFKARQFLLDLINLMLSSSTFLSETSRDILSSNLNPSAYQYVLPRLITMLDDHIEKNSGQELLLVSQISVLLRPVLQRFRDEDEIYFSVDFGSLSLKLVRFLKDMGSSIEVVTVKIYVCQLLESIGNISNSLNLRYELKVRNELVQILVDWLEKSTSFQTISLSSNDKAELEKERSLRELSVQISTSLSTLLNGMIIQVPDDTHEKDVLITKHGIFSNIFSLFLRVLHRCRTDDDDKVSGYNILGEKIQFIRSKIILCLSYMLMANVDVGLRIAISLGYHEDLALRIVFLEIFKNILSQGTNLSPEFGLKKHYEEMIDFLILRKEAMLMLCEVCPANEAEDFAVALLHAFDSRNKSLQLIKDVIIKEIEDTDITVGIFRSNTIATKLLSIYSRSRGLQYLQATLGPFLSNIKANPKDYVFEIEIEKLGDDDDIQENMLKCEKCVEEIMACMERTENLFPSSFREICGTILYNVEKKFPEGKEIALSGFLLLRFICPALVSPQSEGLTDRSLDKPIRRTLLLLAKTLQQIANSTAMKTIIGPDGPWIKKTHIRLLKILQDLALYEESVADDASSQASSNGRILETHFTAVLHKFLYQHWDEAHQRISILEKKKRLASSSHTNNLENGDSAIKQNIVTSPQLRHSTRKDEESAHYKDFSSLIRLMGPPSGVQHSAHIPAVYKGVNGETRLNEFMTRNAQRDISKIIEKRVVTEGISKDGKPVLVINTQNYSPEEMDAELVLYRFFQVASKMWSDEFYILWDCTSNSGKHPFPPEARTLRNSLVPPSAIHNLKKIYYYNVTSEFLPFLKENIRFHGSGIYLSPAFTEYVFLTSANISEYFNVQGLNLNSRSQKVITDIRLVYSNVTKVIPNHSPIPVTLKLGNEFLQIMGEVPFNYVKNSPGFSNDAFHLSEIVNVYIPKEQGSPNDFIIEVIGKRKIFLQNKKRYEIVRAIQNAKSRMPVKDDKSVDNELTMTVEESSGCLLNMGLANLCSSDSEIQEAAYNLLAVIPTRFNLDFERELKGGPGLALPKHEITTAVSFSEAAARSQPSLTYNFLCEFIITHKSLPVEEGINAILYATPWVKNIYKYVYLEDEERGVEHTSFLVRNFLDITFRSATDYSWLILNFWPIICLEDALAGILIDEVVGFVLDLSVDYHKNVENILAVVTSFPTISICGTVLARVRRLLNKTLSEKERSLVDHPNWSELVVLIRLMTYLTFDSLDIVEVYLPEIFLLIISFLYTGPFELRSSLQKLLINVLHSFACSEKLSVERKEHVVTIWNDVASGKGKLLFGLSEETKGMNYDYFVLAALSQIESCCNVLLDILSTVGSVEQGNMWRSRWCSFVMNACFIKSPSLQCRSFLVLGCLARIEVDDVVVVQVLQVLKMAMLTEDRSLGEEYCACTVLCLTKMIDGLSENSLYLARLFWLSLALLRVDNDTVFNNSLLLLQSSLRALDNLGAFKSKSLANFLLGSREPYFEEWKAMMHNDQIDFREEFFDLNISSIVLKGLEKSTTKPGTIDALETLLEISAKNSVREKEDSKKYPSYLCYLYFLYLCCRSQSELKDLLWISGYPDDPMDSENSLERLPRLLKEYLDEESEETTIELALGANLFLASTEYDVIATRFLNSITYVGEKNIVKKCMVYAMVRGKLFRLMETGSTNEMLKATLEAGIGVFRNSAEFEKLSEHRQNLEKLLIEKGFYTVAHPHSASTGTIGAHASNKSNWLNPKERSAYALLIDSLMYK